ncbi:MAG: 4Fe-4S binding protein, partial [Ignavibacteria bacterium]|nr:4Fe-4S binding protein [Ignavibacteria bacterium]
MKNSKLRKIRIAVSIVFLLLTASLFLDITNYLPTKYFSYITFFQFVPSVIKFTNLLIPASIGFVIVLILVLMFGRVYCSSICPLGTIQDITSRLAKNNNKKKKFSYTKEYFWLRYTILALTIIPLFFGKLILVNLLDPYSNTGRILSQLFSPVITIINNLAAFTLEKFNIYLLYPVEIKSFYFISALFPLLFLIAVLYLSYKRGRLYCNTICPVGTLLGIISKFTIFKLKIDESTCEGCGICARVCKSECIEPTSKAIDFSRCVACYNCLDVCPSDSINYQFISSKDIQQNPDESRRNFLSRTSLFFVGLTTTALTQIKIIPKKASKVEVKKKSVSSPPASTSIEHFTSNCTACHLCITSCPTRVLQPSIIEYGIFSIFQPFMDYNTSFC